MAISKRNQKILKKHADELALHFNKKGHGWPLVASCLEGDLLIDLLGFDPLEELVKLTRQTAKVGHVFKLEPSYARYVAKIPKAGKLKPFFRQDGVPCLFDDSDKESQKLRSKRWQKQIKKFSAENKKRKGKRT